MKPEVKAAWIAALLSGKYRQTAKHLRDKDVETGTIGYCCLGVLCDLHRKEHKRRWAKPRQSDVWGTVVYYYGRAKEFYVLPAEVAAWAGLDSSDPVVHDSDTLATLNDNGRPFEEIAWIIKTEL